MQYISDGRVMSETAESTDSPDPDNEDLLGGIDADTTEDVEVPDKLVDQVIGQDHARKVIEKAAEQQRHVMMIGSPGTGKSMLAKAMSELLPANDLQDVLVYPNKDDDTRPKVRTVEAGKGEEIHQAHKEEFQKQQKFRNMAAALLAVGVFGVSAWLGRPVMGLIAGLILYFGYKFISGGEGNYPEVLQDNSDMDTAPFKDATGSHSGALLGDVRHDPFQSGGRGTPAHQRVESGYIHEANDGVMFIDEINTLDVRDQQSLMTAIQEGEYGITGQSERSSGAMVKTEPVPTDFVMVAAGNSDALENMHPALRSRIRGDGYEVYMKDKVDDEPEMRKKFAQFVAQEVDKDENIPHFTRDAMEEIVKESQRRAGEKGKLTLKLRNLGGLIQSAGDLATSQEDEYVTSQHVVDAKEESRSIEQQLVDEMVEKKEKYREASDEDSRTGHVNGLAVLGGENGSGIVLPVVSTVTPAQGPGSVIATGQLKEMAEESVKNVSALIKKISGESLDDKDIHIQFEQVGKQGVDGDSASVTVATAVLSSLTGVPVRQNIAMTGSLNVAGEVRPVGGVTHKIEAAADMGLDEVIIPKANEDNVILEDKYKDQINIETAEHIADVLEFALEDENNQLSEFADHLREEQNNSLLSLEELSPSSSLSTQQN